MRDDTALHMSSLGRGRGPIMKSGLWLLLGVVIGAVAGWYAHALAKQEVRAVTGFVFSDTLADQKMPYLFAAGTWRGSDLANKVNTVEILCNAPEKTCEMKQADVMSLRAPTLSLYSKSFRITKLDAESVLAEPALPDLCIRQILTFDRVAKAVTFTRTKINNEGRCSIVQDEPLTLFLGEPL